ncbi:MAG: HNH endonuclease signature motif containing protein [Patescibacteria group bacterium]
MELKICKNKNNEGCGKEKPIEDFFFHVSKNSRDGLCSECIRKQRRHKRNKGRPHKVCFAEGCGKILNENNKRGYCTAHRSLSAEYQELLKKYRKDNRKDINEKMSDRRKTPEGIEYGKKYIVEHKREKSEKDKQYYNNNKEKRIKNSSEWLRRHPEVSAKCERYRRAKKLFVQENFLLEQEEITRDVFENKCLICKTTENICIDHFCPLNDGYALSLDNAILLCKSHNSSKGAKNPELFFTPEQFILAKELMKKAIEIYEELIENRDKEEQDEPKPDTESDCGSRKEQTITDNQA